MTGGLKGQNRGVEMGRCRTGPGPSRAATSPRRSRLGGPEPAGPASSPRLSRMRNGLGPERPREGRRRRSRDADLAVCVHTGRDFRQERAGADSGRAGEASCREVSASEQDGRVRTSGSCTVLRVVCGSPRGGRGLLTPHQPDPDPDPAAAGSERAGRPWRRGPGLCWDGGRWRRDPPSPGSR